MDKKEIPFELGEIFEDIPEEQRRKIIKACSMMIIGQANKTESKLRENKENVKEWIFRSELAKKVGIERAKNEVELAEFVGSYLIGNRELFINLPTCAREQKLLEEMVSIGIIEKAEVVKKDETPNLKLGEKNAKPNQAITQQNETVQSTRGILINSVIPQQKLVELEPPQVQAPQALPVQTEVIDLASLNRPDLLCTDRTTGKKEIKYGRYSLDKRQKHKFNYQGRDVQLTRVGRMYYKTSLMLCADIDEYLVRTKDGQVDVFTYGLDLCKIEKDEQYRKLFFEQLISDDNMHLKNGNGYIGSIVNTGDEQNKYKIEYSEEEYTAVTELKNRLEQMRQKRIASDKDDR